MDRFKIRERRKLLGWTQESLAERAGLSQSLVSDAENGRATEATLGALNAALKNQGSETVQASDPSPSPPIPPQGLGANSTNPLSRAVSAAFSYDRGHLIDDAVAVLRVYEKTELPTDEQELRRIALHFLDAAKDLREHGQQVTAQAIGGRLALRLAARLDSIS